MTIVDHNINHPGTASLSPSCSVPVAAQPGDIAWIVTQWNSTTNALTPANATVLDTKGPLSGNNCLTVLSKRVLTSGDISGGITGSFSGGTSPRWASGLFVTRGVDVDGTPAQFSDDDATTTAMSFGSYTPTVDSEDVLLLMGITTTSGQGSYTVTPPTGWTVDQAADDAFGTNSNVGIALAHHTTGGGTAGVAQSIANFTASKLLRHNSWAIPLKVNAPASIGWLITASGPVPLGMKIVA
jgi:hypothetical protein